MLFGVILEEHFEMFYMKMITKRALGIRFHMSEKILKIIGLAGKIRIQGVTAGKMCVLYSVHILSIPGGGGGGERGCPGDLILSELQRT